MTVGEAIQWILSFGILAAALFYLYKRFFLQPKKHGGAACANCALANEVAKKPLG